MIGVVEEEASTVLNKTYGCMFCRCVFFTEHDLALHLKAFSDVGEAHREAFRRLHEFLEEYGSDCLNDDYTKVEFRYPSQILADFERIIRDFYKVDLLVRKKFKKRVRG